MDIKVHSIHFDADHKLLGFVEGKVNKLEQYSDSIVSGEVFLRLDKSSDMDNKVAEIKVLMPGKELFAKRQCKSFEEATDLAIDALKRQVKKYKAKMRA